MAKNPNVVNEFKCVVGYEPYFALICAVIESAVKDKDIKYLKSKVCIWHCNLIGLDHDWVMRGVNNNEDKYS